MKLVIASNNAHKIAEIKTIIGGFFEEIYSLKELDLSIDPEETGTTFEENALLKARAVTEATGMCALSDDSGLCVKALNGAPGVYSARYAGVGHDDAENNALLLKNLRGQTDRTAYFVSCVVLTYPDGKEIIAEGRTYGSILTELKGNNGFGYDPLFYSDDLKKSFGEASAEEKNAVSHRGRALAALKEKLTAQHR